MGRIAVLVIGILVSGLGIWGTGNAIATWEEPPKPKSDLSATGIVTGVTVTELKHAIGVTLNSSYEMDFKFQAEDGQTYFGEENITEAQAGSLREGQEVDVKYHSNNPSINAAVDYGTYISVDTFKTPTSQGRLLMSLLITGMGGLIVLYGAKYYGEEEPKKEAEYAAAA